MWERETEREIKLKTEVRLTEKRKGVGDGCREGVEKSQVCSTQVQICQQKYHSVQLIFISSGCVTEVVKGGEELSWWARPNQAAPSRRRRLQHAAPLSRKRQSRKSERASAASSGVICHPVETNRPVFIQAGSSARQLCQAVPIAGVK